MDLFAFVKPKNELESRPEEQTNVPFVPEEMWTKCPKCGTMLLTTDMEENFRVCTKCGHHFRMNAKQRVALLADDGSFCEHDANMASKNNRRYWRSALRNGFRFYDGQYGYGNR